MHRSHINCMSSDGEMVTKTRLSMSCGEYIVSHRYEIGWTMEYFLVIFGRFWFNPLYPVQQLVIIRPSGDRKNVFNYLLIEAIAGRMYSMRTILWYSLHMSECNSIYVFIWLCARLTKSTSGREMKWFPIDNWRIVCDLSVTSKCKLYTSCVMMTKCVDFAFTRCVSNVLDTGQCRLIRSLPLLLSRVNVTWF